MHKHKTIKSLAFVFILGISLSCNTKKDPVQVKFTGKTFGTYYSISYFAEDSISYQHEIDSVLQSLGNSLSIYNPKSLISEINTAGTFPIKTDKYFNDVFIKAIEISEKTEGAFDVTVGPLVNAWGFGFKNKETIHKALIDSLLQLVGLNKIHYDGKSIRKLEPSIILDFNAIAKGYGVDVVAEFLESKGIQTLLVDIGGEVIAKGHKPNGKKWKVGIEKPAKDKNASQELEAIIELEDIAVATSGNYRNYYIEDGIKYAHTIDPKTGYPVSHSLLSATVIAKNCLTADAYATAFMVAGLNRAIAITEKNTEIEAFFIFSDSLGDYKTYATKGMKKMLEE